MVASYQSDLILNAILIFKSHLLENIPEDGLRMAIRCGVIVYATLSKFLEMAKPQVATALTYLTRSEEKS